MTTTSFIWCLVLVVAVMVLGYVRLCLSYRRNISKVAFMFDAIDASDFTFSFSTKGVSGSDAVTRLWSERNIMNRSWMPQAQVCWWSMGQDTSCSIT